MLTLTGLSDTIYIVKREENKTMKCTVFKQTLEHKYTDHSGAHYLMSDGRYYNTGEFLEATDKNSRGLDWHKDANIPWNKGSDIEQTHTSVKSSKFTLASDLTGDTVEEVLEQYFEQVASTNWDYVIQIDEQIYIYNMNRDEFKAFVLQFARIDKTRRTVRGLETSSKTVRWLEERL